MKTTSRIRSAAARAALKNMVPEEAEYLRRKKRDQQRQWREKNRDKLAAKARQRREKIRPSLMSLAHHVLPHPSLQVMSGQDSDHLSCPTSPILQYPSLANGEQQFNQPDSPLPPSDPPSPTSSDVEDYWVDTQLMEPVPVAPKLPLNWENTPSANEFLPAKSTLRTWQQPIPSGNISNKVSNSRKEPILYSFQLGEYRPRESDERLFLSKIPRSRSDGLGEELAATHYHHSKSVSNEEADTSPVKGVSYRDVHKASKRKSVSREHAREYSRAYYRRHRKQVCDRAQRNRERKNKEISQSTPEEHREKAQSKLERVD
ncbi:hypothetical protein VNI00_018859 [Paramarasmius palmivorus]|uniref:Uncharacterized protein n=1 Tax=Paramarasmius palmivorus TaxID=297713 RepID=A0AAW0AT98_9AGAR